MQIRLAKKEDAQAIENVIAMNLGEDWRLKVRPIIQSMFSDDLIAPIFFVAEEQNNIVGCAAICREFITLFTWGIGWVNVLPEHERQGIGQKLIEACLAEIAQRAGERVSVLLATRPGRTGLYDKTGFKKLSDDHAGGHLMIQYVGGKE